MSVKITGIYDLYNVEKVNTENGLENMSQMSGQGLGKGKGVSLFDSELKIQSSLGTRDAYDRVVEKSMTDDLFPVESEGSRALSSEMIDKLAQVVDADSFDKYEEWGLAPDQDDPASILTVSERIEIELAMTCEDYVPTGNISMSDIEAMYGKTGRAYKVADALIKQGVEPREDTVSEVEETLDKVAELQGTGISSGMAEYLIANHLPPSVDNVYKASHSVAAGGAAKEAQSHVYQRLSDGDWESLKPQVKSVLEKTGLTETEEVMADAKWLVETKLPVTGENLYGLSQIRQINEQLQSQAQDEGAWTEKLAKDRVFLETAGASSLDYYSTIEADSIEAVTILNEGTEDQVATLVMDGNDVTLLNLKRLQEDRTIETAKERSKTIEVEKTRERAVEAARERDTARDADFQKNENEETKRQQKIIAAQRTLEEARLKLTVSSGAFLLKNGWNISVASLSDTVEKLRQMEQRLTEEIFTNVGYTATAKERELFDSTAVYMREFTATPSYVLGSVFDGTVSFSVAEVTEYGRSRNFKMAMADMAYDTLGTKPDRTLGDSLSKAFSHIPELLSSLGMEDSVMNQRAVRILAHNAIEINPENLSRVKELDTQVSRLVENLTPKTTAYLIANGINPLHTDIGQLNDVLEQIHAQIGRDDVEKYSEYLYRLDKKGAISTEDREAYIGIYRALHMIEKADRRALGALAKQGGELTMRNLLTVARSLSHSDKEVMVDDELGMAEEIAVAENSIDRQLRHFETDTFYRRAKEKMRPELAEKMLPESEKEALWEAPLQEFLQHMSDASFEMAERDNEEDKAYKAFLSSELNELAFVSEEAVSHLMEDGLTGNMRNLRGIGYMMKGDRRIYDRILSVCEDEAVSQSVERLQTMMAEDEGMETSNETDLESSIEELNENVRQALLYRTAIRPEDIRQVNGAVRYIREAAEQRSYYVPVTLADGNTLLKLTLKNDEEHRGAIDIRMYADEEIKLSVQADQSEGRWKLRCRESKGILRARADEMLRRLEKDIESSSIAEAYEDGREQQLFTIAKRLVGELKKQV